MPQFAGIDHLALTVSDLDVSTAFYRDVLDFGLAIDAGDTRVLVHRATGFTIGLVKPHAAGRERFDPLRTGLDHLGLAAASRAELEGWERRLDAAGVAHSPIQDLPLGHHLNFADPDGIALELHAPTDLYAAALAELRTSTISDAEVRARVAAMLAAAPG